MISAVRRWFSGLYGEVRVLVLAAFDRRVPWGARAVALAVAAYVISPFDLIPDFLPFAGWIDDAIVVPVGLWLARRLIPEPVLADLRARDRARDVATA